MTSNEKEFLVRVTLDEFVQQIESFLRVDTPAHVPNIVTYFFCRFEDLRVSSIVDDSVPIWLQISMNIFKDKMALVDCNMRESIKRGDLLVLSSALRTLISLEVFIQPVEDRASSLSSYLHLVCLYQMGNDDSQIRLFHLTDDSMTSALGKVHKKGGKGVATTPPAFREDRQVYSHPPT